MDLVQFQDLADLVEFVVVQCDVYRGHVFKDPRLVGGTGDRDDVGTYG
jgi:hypothetical protein